MSQIIRSDLTRNFAGGFVLGAALLFSMQPQDARLDFASSVVAATNSIAAILV